MFTIITTEEYRGLIEAEREAEIFKKAYQENKAELQELKAEINSLLLMLTNNDREPRYSKKDFQIYEIADCDVIALYINEFFVEDGKLKLKEIEEW